MVTFIIPTISRPSLDKAVNSLINQTNKNWKCIILFDGIEGRNFKDDRITSIKIDKTGKFGKNHGNAGLVRNKGIELAKTDWIAFLDDDDTLNENYVDWLYSYINKGYEMVLFRMKTVKDRIIPAIENNEIVLHDAGISFAYKKSLNCKFINSDGEDYHFLNEIRKKTKNYVIAKEVAYYVRS
jgi:glycosyltransferase involved in cell wall biosynthesis